MLDPFLLFALSIFGPWYGGGVELSCVNNTKVWRKGEEEENRVGDNESDRQSVFVTLVPDVVDWSWSVTMDKCFVDSLWIKAYHTNA